MIEEIKRLLPKRPKDPPSIVVKSSLVQKIIEKGTAEKPHESITEEGTVKKPHLEICGSQGNSVAMLAPVVVCKEKAMVLLRSWSYRPQTEALLQRETIVYLLNQMTV